MIVVTAPERSTHGETTRVSAFVELGGRHVGEIWFEADGEAGTFLSDRADAFAAAVLPVANALGGRMHVRGVVSPRLAWGLRELLRIHRVWWPRHGRPLELTFDRLEAPSVRPAAVGCGFSGGLDSFYSVWQHLARNETIPGFPITHLVMIRGFDHDVDEPGRFEALRAVYEPLAQQEGVRLITIRTNVGQQPRIRLGLDPHQWLGGLLAVPALALGAGLARYYISAGEGYADLMPYGSSPITDSWYSTETLDIVHDGGDATRPEKLEAVSQWPECRTRLRVCRAEGWRNVDFERGVVDNCGRCEKCIRTMLSLTLMGKLDQFPVFRGKLTRRAIAGCRLGETFFAGDNLRLALAKRRYDLAVPLWWSITAARLRKLAKRIARPGRSRLGAAVRTTRIRRPAIPSRQP